MPYQSTVRPHPQFMIYPKRKSALDQQAMMYMRVTYDIHSVEKSLGVKISYDNWDRCTHQISSQPLHDAMIKQRTDEYKQKIMGAYYMLTKDGAEFTIREILDNAFGNKGTKLYSLMGVFENQILLMEKQLNTISGKYSDSGTSGGKSNMGKHRTCLRHLKNYLKKEYRLSDIGFSRINRSFIDGFEIFLKTDAGNSHNSAMKMMQIFKKIYRVAVDNRWTAVNAFAGKRISFTNVDMPYLTQEEIHVLMDHVFQNARLEHVRDLFIFCCYTGVAYIDLKTLQRKHFEFNPVSKQYFIKKKRHKTNQLFIVPLFGPAKRILDTRVAGWETLTPDASIFSVMSNQKYNDYLKEVAAFCGIEKKLKSHMARHSFASSVALENGVSMESTSRMLGHSKISQTQKYGKVNEIKIEKDTRDLFLQLS